MGIFDDFEYKEKSQNEEKVIEALKKILRAIHLNNYRDIMDCVKTKNLCTIDQTRLKPLIQMN
ncbi:hypothetical protein [Streptococcus infantis]|uniref:Uncharacterized protein n=1 Tax=Streptococcus infantis SPAR10 TaxID=1159208 RepID=J1SDE0_9STRE|nr:hypothetical protein [Streptococcus infantis]EJG87685.1 hypothetical protein SPAR10_1259 [Streptococcus infantis SPAR10]